MPDPVKIADLNKETSFSDDDSFVFSDSSAGLDKRIEGSDIRKNISADIENVTALKLFEGTRDGQIVWLNGHGEEGDGGEGVVRWDASSTEAANDVNIFQVTGVTTGRWKRPITDRIHLAWAGVIESGDETTKLVNALTVADSESKPLSLDGLDITVVGEVDPPSVTIYGEGGSITSDGTGFVLRAAGTADTYYSNDLLAKKGDSWIVNASLAAEVSKGDLVQIQSDERIAPNREAGQQGADYTWGEMHLVNKVVGDKIYFEASLFHTYPSLDESATDTRARKVTPTLFNIYDTKIKQPDIDGASGVIVQFGYKNDIEVSVTDCKRISVRVDNSYRVNVNSRSSNSRQTGAGYGVDVTGCSMFTRVKGTYLNCRHAFATGPSGSDGASWGTEVSIIGSVSVDHSGSAIFDTHPDCGSVYFKNCIGMGTAPDSFSSKEEWDDATPYSSGEIVYGSDGMYYTSLVSDNTGNNPTTDERENWRAGDHLVTSLFGLTGGEVYIENCHAVNCRTGVLGSFDIILPTLEINGLYMKNGRRLTSFFEGFEVNNLRIDNVEIDNDFTWGHANEALITIVNNVTIHDLHIGNVRGINIPLAHITGDITGIDTIDISNAKVKSSINYAPAFRLSTETIRNVRLTNFQSDGFEQTALVTTSLDKFSLSDFESKNAGLQLANLQGDVDSIIFGNGEYTKVAGAATNAAIILPSTNYAQIRIQNVDIPSDASVKAIIECLGTMDLLIRNGNNFDGNGLYWDTNTTPATLEVLGGDPEYGGVYRGSGTPESSVTANVGSFYQRTDGGAGTSLYVKESGTGNTGWVAK